MSLDSQCMLLLFFFKHLCRYGSATLLHNYICQAISYYSTVQFAQYYCSEILFFYECQIVTFTLTWFFYWQVLVVFYFVELLQRGYLAKRQLREETVSL